MNSLILVVEDNPLNSELLCNWLEIEGHEALAVDNLQAAREKAQGRTPTLVLLDIGLGGEDGLGLVTWMREQPSLCQIPIIAVSAHAMIADQQRMMSAGCSAFVAKPIDFERLREEMRRWLPGDDESGRPPRVLIVEDDPASLELLRISLEAKQVEVRPTQDSREAAKLVESERFDGIFLDLVMPEIDGFELTRCIRRSRLNARAPIIVVSGREEQRTMQEAFAAGGTFFLQKPLDQKKLGLLLNTTLGAIFQRRQRWKKKER
jgi:two-component system cell cycle response regulator